ncbi:MAG: Gldg family protein [Coleofasciculaceae cyanobacterium]
MTKYLKYLFWLGPILSIMGITAGFVSGKWLPVPLGLLIAGLVIIGLWLLFVGSTSPSFWGRRSLETGTNAVIATLLVLVILGLINFLAIRNGPRIDLTENQFLSLSPLSQQVVQKLEQPVKVWVFVPSADPADRELLENYHRYGSKLEFDFVDPQVELGAAKKFNVQDYGEVYLEYGPARQLVQRIDQVERLSEVKLTNAIARLTSDRYDKVYFLQGHGELSLEEEEGGLSEAVSALEERNFTTQPLNLTERSAVPEDASLVVVAGPKRALLEKEVKTLINYLSQGGSLLLMIDPDTNPDLDDLLKNWGVRLDSRIVIDATTTLGFATPLVSSYGDHPISKDFGNGYSFYPLARPLEVESVKGVELTPLLITTEQTWAESNPEEQPPQFEPESDFPGPLMLGAALNRQVDSSTKSSKSDNSDKSEIEESEQPQASPSPTSEEEASAQDKTETEEEKASAQDKTKTEEKTEESRLVVFGDSNFPINGLFEQQLNGDVFINSISWLSRRDDQIISIRPKEQKNRRINLTPIQANALGWTALVILPLFGFTTAGVVWWLRR